MNWTGQFSNNNFILKFQDIKNIEGNQFLLYIHWRFFKEHHTRDIDKLYRDFNTILHLTAYEYFNLAMCWLWIELRHLIVEGESAITYTIWLPLPFDLP